MKKVYLLLTSLLLFISCLKSQNKFEGEYTFKTLHYIQTSNTYDYNHKIKKYGNDHFLFGKGSVKVFYDDNSKKYIISVKYRNPRANWISKYPKLEYRNYNFTVSNIILLKDSLRFTLSAGMGTVMLEGKIFKENNKMIFAIEKDLAKIRHINNKKNPWFFKIDNEYVYYNLNEGESTDIKFYKKQLILMKDSLKLKQLDKRKIERMKNGIKYIEELIN